MHIRNPVEWSLDQVRSAGSVVGRTARRHEAAVPRIRRISLADLRYALARGIDDFAAFRSDVVFLVFVYPLAGLVLARLAFGYDLLPLLFPLASGFALIGPIAAVCLYEMSRRREAGAEEVGWADAFAVFRSPAIGSIVLFGLLLLAIFAVWIGVASTIYDLTLGPKPPVSAAAFVHDVFATEPGWTMIGLGIGIGFLFAVAVLAISIVSVPLLLDRDVGLFAAIGASLRAVLANPGPLAVWGMIVAGALVLGTAPLFLGLVFVMPVLGHATWHLYRRLVASE